ncbi:MAG TPA: hypothetical protein VFG00_12520, partial [Acidothermaceae bacterium]|nr:hypothetical protein [Acidothermaceae bacterium]
SLASNLGHPAPQLAKVVASAGIRAAVAAGSSTPGIAVAAHGAFLSGFRLILVIGAALVAAGAFAGAALVRGSDFANRMPAAPAHEPAVAVPAE